jgi:hypothetical protein
MTVYVPITWENEVPNSTPIKYSITGDSEGVISASAQIAQVTPVTAGTPVNAANLNHIEQGISDVQDRVAALEILGKWPFENYIYQPTDWDGDSKAVGTYVLNVATVFGVPSTTKAILFWVSGTWSTASNGNLLSLGYDVAVPNILVRGIVANMDHDRNGIVPVKSNGTIWVNVAGNAALVQLKCLGYAL